MDDELGDQLGDCFSIALRAATPRGALRGEVGAGMMVG